MSFRTFTLLLPYACETHGGTEFPRFGFLLLGNIDGSMKTSFCFFLVMDLLLLDSG